MSAEAMREKAVEALNVLRVRLQDPKPGHTVVLAASDCQMMRALLETVARYVTPQENVRS